MKTKGWILGTLLVLACGCRHMSNTESGALGGAGLGALTGAVVGNQLGDTGAGALIGGIGGALAGCAIGNGIDRAEERAEERAVQRIHHEQAVQAAQAPPLTVDEVIFMTQNGVSEEVIIQKIHSSGTNFHLTTTDLVRLSQAHVGSRVINEMQKSHTIRPVVIHQPPPPTPVVERRVIVHEYEPPPPTIHFGFGYRRPIYRRCHPRYCW